MDENITPDHLPWYQSRVMIGALVSAILKLVAAVGVTVQVTDEQTQAIVTVLVLLGSLVGDYVAAKARVTQTAAPPLTLKKRS